MVWRRRSRDSALRQLASYRESGPTIPRVFHHIWVGPDALPLEFEANRASWQTHHPEWEFRLWTDANLPADLRTPAVYERDRRPVERADILRLESLTGFAAEMCFQLAPPCRGGSNLLAP